LSFHSFGLSCSPKGRCRAKPASLSWRPSLGREEIVARREGHAVSSRDPRAVSFVARGGEREAQGRGRDARRVVEVTDAGLSARGVGVDVVETIENKMIAPGPEAKSLVVKRGSRGAEPWR
jgi:hypothetical protein